jgi:hypothetical protein
VWASGLVSGSKLCRLGTSMTPSEDPESKHPEFLGLGRYVHNVVAGRAVPAYCCRRATVGPTTGGDKPHLT